MKKANLSNHLYKMLGWILFYYIIFIPYDKIKKGKRFVEPPFGIAIHIESIKARTFVNSFVICVSIKKNVACVFAHTLLFICKIYKQVFLGHFHY